MTSSMNPFPLRAGTSGLQWAMNGICCTRGFHEASLFTVVETMVCAAVVSISPTFYEQFLRQFIFAKRLQTQTVST